MQSMNSRVRWALGVLWVLSFVVVLASLRFAFVAIEIAQPAMINHALTRPLMFYGHVTGASIALALLPLQFWTKLRQRRLRLHRWLGRVYGLSVLVGGISGVWLAASTEAGTIAGAGFAVLGILWLLATAKAVQLAMAGNITCHRRWMIRSAGFTLAAVALRVYLPFLSATFGFAVGYTLVAWLCWVPNAIIVEWLLRRENQHRPLVA